MKKHPRYSHLTMEPFNKQIEAPPDFNRPAIQTTTPPAASTPAEAKPAPSSIQDPPTPQAPEPISSPSGQSTASPAPSHRTYTMEIPVVDPRDRARIAREFADRPAANDSLPLSPETLDAIAAAAERIAAGDFSPAAPPSDYDLIFRAADIVSKYLTKIAELKPAVHRPLPLESLEVSQRSHHVRPGFTGARTPAARHARKCGICTHPDREAIEFAFIQWHNVDWIARKYRVDPYSIYRHAHAVNLFDRRGRNVAAVLEKLMEDAAIVRASPASIIQAVRAYSRITDYVKWVEPPQIHVSAASAGRSSRRSRRSSSKPKKKRTLIRKARSSRR